jgi:hypothetical protein
MYLILEPMPAPVEEPVVAGTCVVVVVAPVEFMWVELVEEEFMVMRGFKGEELGGARSCRR